MNLFDSQERQEKRRSQRYYHQRDDDNLIELLVDRDDVVRMEGRYHNISQTGMKFSSRRPIGLKVGDTCQVLVPVPQLTSKISSRARIVRKESDQDFAVEFIGLAESAKEMLLRGIEIGLHRAKYKWLRDSTIVVREFIKERWTMLLMLATTVLLTGVSMYFLTLPIGNYSPAKTTPWGTRFGEGFPMDKNARPLYEFPKERN